MSSSRNVRSCGAMPRHKLPPVPSKLSFSLSGGLLNSSEEDCSGGDIICDPHFLPRSSHFQSRDSDVLSLTGGAWPQSLDELIN